MFSRVVPSSPVLELNNLNFNSFIDNTNNSVDNFDNHMEQKSTDANFNVMVNQLYMNQLLNSSNTTPTIASSQFAPQANYQYTMNPSMHSNISHQQPELVMDTMNNFFSDSFLQTPPSLDDVPGTSTTTSTSSSDMDSLNLQFIHPQDVVSFPSIHACTPPMEQFNSRRASLLDTANTIPLKSLIDLELKQQQQHQQQQQFNAQQQMLAQPLPQPTAEELLSSVETTPIMSDMPLPHLHSSLDEIASQKLIPSSQNLNFHNMVKTESVDSFNMESESYHNYYSNNSNKYFKEEDEDVNEEIPEITEIKKFRVVRGVSSGGCATRPPKEAKNSSSTFAKVKLHLASAGVEDMCYPNWNDLEKADRRRIIRIERRQNCANIVASFSIVGSAIDHPEPAPAEEGVDVVEVSCLETVVDENYDDYENESFECSGDETLLEDDIIKKEQEQQRFFQTQFNNNGGSKTQYYITSVEVIKIVELLIGSQPLDGANRRRERGRVRSNLVPFWSRKPVSSKKNHSASSSPIDSSRDFRIELAQRIMGYETRKPRGFDKEVRILKWEKLIPALRRALQSYYVEIPEFSK